MLSPQERKLLTGILLLLLLGVAVKAWRNRVMEADIPHEVIPGLDIPAKSGTTAD